MINSASINNAEVVVSNTSSFPEETGSSNLTPSLQICRRTKRHGLVSCERIDTKLGREIIRKYHYSHKTNTAHQYYLGCFIEKTLVGVASFGTAMNPNSCSKIVTGTSQKEYLELARLYVQDGVGDNIETVFLSLCWRWIRKNLPKVKWIQSFADGRVGVGIVYQAANFVYCGFHISKFYKDIETGEVFHNSILSRKTRKKYWELQSRLDKIEPFTVNTYRYIYFLDNSVRKNLTYKVLPYPKN